MRARPLLILFVLLLSTTWLFSSGLLNKKNRPPADPGTRTALDNKLREKLQEKAAEARLYAKSHSYHDQLFFLIDMSLPSSQNRFFVYDSNGDSARLQGLVTHGRCNENWLEGRRYSNEIGSGCTSLGKYKVGYSYNGRFGLAYKLYGLDKSNSNAFQRFVVLHSHECVPNAPDGEELCQSDGCPTVSPAFLQELKKMITGSKKPVLLWIYE
ncbi:MAG: murein L,D-transpeptidase catalytic domain family protein [Chitinophagaceae bacterium]